MDVDELVIDETYKIGFNMSVLDALGINLYSNATAVLSEVVANAWDADATKVQIDWDHEGGEVRITDDGCGMTVVELNDRYLEVGYQKRDNEGLASPKFDRPFMGRKGIGKLSIFSIADEIQLLSMKNGSTNGFTIHVEALREAIRSNLDYHPVPVVDVSLSAQGTQITLRKLKKSRTTLTSAALRKRLARRFDVLKEIKPEDGDFGIFIDGKRITYDDREELKRLEYIWEIGGSRIPAEHLPSDIGRFEIGDDIVGGIADWKVTGWFGTVKKPNDLVADEDAGSLKSIIVLARNRPIQESILDKLNFNRIFGNYVTGQIGADFLDLDHGNADIATSDRQRLMEDDPRVVALQNFLREKFLKASEEWAEARPSKKSNEVKEQIPEIAEWIDGLKPWQKKPAEVMIGTIASLELSPRKSTTQRADLYRSGILAFERIGLRETLEDLQELSQVDAASLLPILERQDTYESALYGDILRSRIDAITAFQELTSANEKEKVLQRHLFDHLWLLDSSWERAALSERLEEDLRKIDPDVFAQDPGVVQENGRIDIRFATNAGKHIIVELKRYDRKVDVDELYDQGNKYARSLDSYLRARQESAAIEVIFVIGGHPTAKRKGFNTSEEDYIQSTLDNIHGRYVTYDSLITNARAQYEQYLDAKSKVSKLNAALERIGQIQSDDS